MSENKEGHDTGKTTSVRFKWPQYSSFALLGRICNANNLAKRVFWSTTLLTCLIGIFFLNIDIKI